MYHLWCILLFKTHNVLAFCGVMRSKSRFLFRKGAIEVIFHLDKVGKAGYYELYKKDFVVSRQAFANLLKELEKRGLVNRKVLDGRPPRVEYSLTLKGKEIAGILEKVNRLLD